MAIIANYTFQNDIIENAYYRIKKITLARSDDDKLIDRPDGHQETVIETTNENVAFVFIYADHEARKANARPINQFGIFFDHNEKESPWKSAYEALKKTEKLANIEFKDI